VSLKSFLLIRIGLTVLSSAFSELGTQITATRRTANVHLVLAAILL
jgi:hypothetical protein